MGAIPKTLIALATDMGILGALLVSLGYPFAGNVVWTISNPYITYYNWKVGQKDQFKLFLVFSAVSLFGVYNLWPK